MFEKEAEERVKDYIIEKWDCLMKPCKTLEDCRSKELEFDDAVNLVKDGAEFGYNKAKEEMQEQIDKMKMCCNCEKWRNWKEEFDDISYPCSKHNATDKCTLWKLKEK